jgi:hypothetical protein
MVSTKLPLVKKHEKKMTDRGGNLLPRVAPLFDYNEMCLDIYASN